MNESKFKARLRGMSQAAQKTYAALPLTGTATAAQIRYDANAINLPVPQDMGILSGCLYALVRAGLVLEPSKGLFERAPVRIATTPEPDEFDSCTDDLIAVADDPTPAEVPAETPAIAPQPEVEHTPTPNRVNTVNTNTTADTTPASGLALLVQLDNKLESLAKSFQAVATELREARELTIKVSSAVVNDIEANGEAMAKLKQLQTLLKGL